MAALPTPFHAPLPVSRVQIDDPFWSPRLQANVSHTVPFLHRQLQEVGALDAFDLAAYAGKPRTIPKHNGVTPQMWWDSDVGKWIEAASFTLLTHPDAALEAQLDALIARMAQAQQPDGYFNTYFTAVEPEKRLTNERDWHELYNAGHLIEGAVAHFEATGKTSFLEIVERYVQFLQGVYGPAEGQRQGYPGHEEIELALIKLYRATGKQTYLEFARYFVDQRGQQPSYFDEEARARGEDPADFWAGTYEYMQAHQPVREQGSVVGHAVRAMYLYAAMADLAAEDGDAALQSACEQLWQELVSRRLYLTGGLGPSATNEGMTTPYDLPNETAYAETCAGVGLVFWARRMAALTGEGHYADVMEQALYNNVLSGISQSGECFFYENPLASQGDHHRWAWHSCPCCPPNVSRLLASLGEYIYSAAPDELAVQLYIGSEVSATLGGQPLTLRQTTRYPWEGQVRFQLDLAAPATFALRLRVPGWCPQASLSLNGVPLELEVAQGYLRLEREWQPGDKLELTLDLAPQRRYAHPAVRQNTGLVALQRGPLVYCVEGLDIGGLPDDLLLPRGSALSAHFEPELLGGAVVIEAQAQLETTQDWQGTLYRAEPPHTSPVILRALPYALWDHREATPMRVWLREGLDAGSSTEPSSLS